MKWKYENKEGDSNWGGGRGQYKRRLEDKKFITPRLFQEASKTYFIFVQNNIHVCVCKYIYYIYISSMNWCHLCWSVPYKNLRLARSVLEVKSITMVENMDVSRGMLKLYARYSLIHGVGRTGPSMDFWNLKTHLVAVPHLLQQGHSS